MWAFRATTGGGIWFGISVAAILLGAVVVLLAKKNKGFQNWAEKELHSFAKWRLKREARKNTDRCKQAGK